MTDPDWRSIGDFYDRYDGASVEMAYSGPKTFLKGEPGDVRTLDDPDVAVLGVPYDGALSNRPGARYGPDAVRRASGWWAYLSGYKGGLTNVNTGAAVDFSDLTVVDCGDVPVFPMDRGQTAESIYAHVAAAAERAFPVTIGGDHYCTYPAFCGFAAGSSSSTVGLVQIDAHSDTVGRSPKFGEHFHGSSTRLVAESPYSNYEHVSQVGIRGYESANFFQFVDETGLTCYTMRDVRERGIEEVVRAAVDAAAEDTDGVYVTFDIDAVDPGVAPGTGTPEPGGLSARQALRVVEILGTRECVQGVDLMEVSPTYDPTNSTQLLGASLLVTLLERRFAE
ncbi:agmatinase family protein [Halovivax sp.]|uniref:agmatinase family protein n=1 Tax=Halovivax sp. TaxID=1935978 RepID=UPI0025BFD300|nr:agmatinase family protein [Halovivax sp.]